MGAAETMRDPFAFFRPLVITSDADRQRLDAGGTLSRVIAGQQHAIAVFSATPVDVNGDRLVSWMRQIAALKKSDDVEAVERFSKPSATFHDFHEYERLVQAAKSDPDAYLVVLLGGEAGLRCGEMMALEWTDLDLSKPQTPQLCIQRSDWKGQVTTTKSGRLRYVPLTLRLAGALREHRHLKSNRVLCSLDGHALTQRLVQGLVARAARRANLRNVGVHVFRHTFCSHLAMKGAGARAIQELAGHRDLSTTQRYMHVSPAAVESAIRLLDAPAFPLARGDSGETASAAR